MARGACSERMGRRARGWRLRWALALLVLALIFVNSCCLAQDKKNAGSPSPKEQPTATEAQTKTASEEASC